MIVAPDGRFVDAANTRRRKLFGPALRIIAQPNRAFKLRGALSRVPRLFGGSGSLQGCFVFSTKAIAKIGEAGQEAGELGFEATGFVWRLRWIHGGFALQVLLKRTDTTQTSLLLYCIAIVIGRPNLSPNDRAILSLAPAARAGG